MKGASKEGEGSAGGRNWREHIRGAGAALHPESSQGLLIAHISDSTSRFKLRCRLRLVPSRCRLKNALCAHKAASCAPRRRFHSASPLLEISALQPAPLAAVQDLPRTRAIRNKAVALVTQRCRLVESSTRTTSIRIRPSWTRTSS